MKTIVPENRTLGLSGGMKPYLATMRVAILAAFMGIVLTPFDIPLNIATGLVIGGLGVAVIGGLVVFVTWAARKGKAIKKTTAWTVGIVGGVIIIAGVGMYLVVPSGGPGPSGGGGTSALTAYVVPSVDTTASLPASPYTACTSTTLFGLTGQSGVGVVWAAANAVYNPQTSQFLEQETLTTTVASGAASFLSAECFQMKFTFQYKQVPSIQGVLQKQPFMLKVDGITYTAPVTNNGTAGQTNPVFFQFQSGTVQGDWGLLILDKNSAWHPACGEYSQQTALPTTGCGWVTLGTNDGTTVDSVTFMVIINRIGPFGYDKTASPQGKQDVINFEIGLPQGQVGSTPGYYMPSNTYSLAIVRNN